MALIDCATGHTRAFVVGALPGQARRLLEIGCGKGALAAALVEEEYDVTAIDPEAEAVKAARKRGVDALQAEWPCRVNGRFDAILFTRSLHHMADLGTSLDAAGAALEDGGRVVVEDFMAEGGSERSTAWFRSFATWLDHAGLLREPTPYLLQILGRAEPERHSHQHHLHGSAEIEEALQERFAVVTCEPTAYYFRYLLPTVEERLASAILEHEKSLIASGSIDALGRRYIASV